MWSATIVLYKLQWIWYSDLQYMIYIDLIRRNILCYIWYNFAEYASLKRSPICRDEESMLPFLICYCIKYASNLLPYNIAIMLQGCVWFNNVTMPIMISITNSEERDCCFWWLLGNYAMCMVLFLNIIWNYATWICLRQKHSIELAYIAWI